MEGWEWITVARPLTKRPCRLKALIVTPSAANSEMKVYDGGGTADPPVLSIYLAAQNSQPYYFGQGLLLDRGLYIGSFTNITGVLVQWEGV
jgi:hypothetical protein